MKFFFGMFIFLILATGATTQTQNVKPLIQQKMERLRFLEGKWEGESSTMIGSGKEERSTVRENIRFRMDGTLLVLEGLGLRLENPTDTVHHAFGLIAYDLKNQTYNLRAYRNGLYTDAEARFLDDGRFEWRMENPYAGLIKYTVSLDEAGQWVEIGESSRDGGKSWMKFLEMKLRKIKE